MLRTQVQIPEQQLKKLRQLSKRMGKSVAQQVREALDLYLGRLERQALGSLADIAGRFRPIPIEDLKGHDRAFIEGILEPTSARRSPKSRSLKK